MPRSKSSLGLDENLVGFLCYLFCWVSGLIFLILERKSIFVKFHAIQSTLTFLALTVLKYLIDSISYVPIIGWLFGRILYLALDVLWLVLWALLMYKAFIGERYKLPFVGDIADRYSGY